MRVALMALLMMTTALAGCVSGSDDAEATVFPNFEATADDGMTYSNAVVHSCEALRHCQAIIDVS